VFQEHGVKVVKITPFEKYEEFEEFIVKFESIMKAQKALIINNKYNLRPNWPERPKASHPRKHLLMHVSTEFCVEN